MKKIECILKSFRVHELSLALTKFREDWVNLWWQDVRGLSSSPLLQKSSGAQFSTAVIPMVHLSILVEDDKLDSVISRIQESTQGDEHAEETLVVSDLTNARAHSLAGSD